MGIECLKEAGLTEGEIKVYLALLEIGSSTTGPIVEKSGISRSIIYHILEKLIQKGLVSRITKNKTKFFQAQDPQKIMDYMNERKQQFEKNMGDVEKLLPELMLKQSMAQKSEANMYFGFKGIVTAHEHSYLKLKKGDEYVYMGVPAYQPKEQHMYWKRDHLRRAKAGITTRILVNRDTSTDVLKNRNGYKGCDARYMPKGIKTPAWFMIYKDTVLIGLPHPNTIAVEIVNKEIASSFFSYFEEFWSRSEPYKK